LAISAAAAFVKVRHKTRSGKHPSRRRLRTLSVNTFVFPDPAEAATHAEWTIYRKNYFPALNRAGTLVCFHKPGRGQGHAALHSFNVHTAGGGLLFASPWGGRARAHRSAGQTMD
jgi:hypothetical protein